MGNARRTTSGVFVRGPHLSKPGVLIVRLLARLRRLIIKPPRLDATERFADHLANEFSAVFAFLWDPSVDATNWRVEHAIRPAVVTSSASKPGEKKHSKRMATVAAVYAVAPFVRRGGVPAEL